MAWAYMHLFFECVNSADVRKKLSKKHVASLANTFPVGAKNADRKHLPGPKISTIAQRVRNNNLKFITSKHLPPTLAPYYNIILT